LRWGNRSIINNVILDIDMAMKFDIDTAMKIDVLSVNDVFDTGLATVLDAFATANELAVAQGLTSVAFDVSVVGLGRQVRTKQGFTVPVLPAKGRAPADWVIVPAIGEKAPQPLAAALATPETQAAARLLRQWADDGAHVAAACIGTFIAAESGVLDGETVTTTWWLAPFFRQRYPRVRLDDRRSLSARAACSPPAPRSATWTWRCG
jgi:transcriptional regulator GlxA family with amidase domain